MKGNDIAVGRVQLIVLGFNQPEFHGEIIAELEVESDKRELEIELTW